MQAETVADPSVPQLKRSLAPRHVSMIAFGGIIGAGLFVGSSASIALAGPAIVLSYLGAGVIILMVMRMLGEMATAHPGLGAFTEYARLGLGEWAGFTTGWLYWYFWVAVVGVEALAGASILSQWIALPKWEIGAVLVAGMTGVNLLSARAFGEFEFWFASIKVGAIVLFILATATFLGLAHPPHGARFANLYALGGFAPHGWLAVAGGVASVIFALTGAEIATIAAAESREPDRAVARITNSVVARILLFYVLSVLLIVTVLPWTAVRPGVSPFAQTLAHVGVPGAATVMNLVVLTAVLSCLNSGLYVCSRVLFTLAGRGQAPAVLAALGGNQTPRGAILLTGAVGLGLIGCSIASPDRLFPFLINASGAVMLIAYLILALAQIALRRRGERAGESGRPALRMWLFPWLSYATVAAILASLAAMAGSRESATELYTSLFSLAATLGCYVLLRRRFVARPPVLSTQA